MQYRLTRIAAATSALLLIGGVAVAQVGNPPAPTDDSARSVVVDDNPSASDLGGVDISGPCDEAEHANDPRCGGSGVASDDSTSSTVPSGSDDRTSTTMDDSTGSTVPSGSDDHTSTTIDDHGNDFDDTTSTTIDDHSDDSDDDSTTSTTIDDSTSTTVDDDTTSTTVDDHGDDDDDEDDDSSNRGRGGDDDEDDDDSGKGGGDN